MATDFNKPVVTDAYATLLPGLVTANKDLAMMLEPTLTGTSTNLPTGAVRWNATTIRWERYNGTAWVTLPAAGNNVYAISISGNAATATALATARTIGGVSFNGTANINLPGVNTEGNQNTSGNAATATKLATARTIGGVSFDGTANINLPGVNTTGNQNTSGNAATASGAAAASGNYFFTAGIGAGAENNIGALCNGYEPAYLFNSATGWGFYSVDGGLMASYLRSTSKFTFEGDCTGNAATATKLASDTGSAPSYSCRAWVNFNGTGSVSIRASGNVTSITDNGTGDYTVNFTTAMPDANYSAQITHEQGPSQEGWGGIHNATAPSTGSLRIHTGKRPAGTGEDRAYVCVTIFR